MKKWKYASLSRAFLAAFLILLFVYTATDKWFHPSLFKATLNQSIFLASLGPVLYWLVPLAELGISVLLLLPQARAAGFLLSALLLSVFSLYIMGMLLFEPHLPCSCGGIVSALGWKEHLALNISLALLSFLAWSAERPAATPLNALFE